MSFNTAFNASEMIFCAMFNRLMGRYLTATAWYATSPGNTAILGMKSMQESLKPFGIGTPAAID